VHEFLGRFSIACLPPPWTIDEGKLTAKHFRWTRRVFNSAGARAGISEELW
jgi:hypothetical protein